MDSWLQIGDRRWVDGCVTGRAGVNISFPEQTFATIRYYSVGL